MKRNILLSLPTWLRRSTVLSLGTLLLLGMSGCNPTGTQNPASPQKSSEQPKASIKAGGSSSAIGLLHVLSDPYRVKNPDIKLNLLEPGQSENAIAGVKQKILDIAAIAKKLPPEENDGTLIFREIAQDGLLVATHESVTGITGVTTAQLQDIYSGKVSNWKELGGPDAPIVVLDRPEDESAKKLLRKHYLGKDLKNASTAITLRKEGELIQSLRSTPYSIGAFSLAHAIGNKLPVNRLSLDKVAPTVETIKNGQYKMIRTIGLVWHSGPNEATKSLIQYIESPEGRQQMEAAGYVTVPSQETSK
jgi:phosphate transport system substrate-binding protein